jgi:DNA-directed RNA polymerase subunit M/transcription elongation factor TFIIS
MSKPTCPKCGGDDIYFATDGIELADRPGPDIAGHKGCTSCGHIFDQWEWTPKPGVVH